MTLTNSQIKAISQDVYRRFPELDGARPNVQPQSTPTAKGAKDTAGERYLLTFKRRAPAPGGRTLERIVRVVADARGRVLKLSTSR